jgi:hypothetical protein
VLAVQPLERLSSVHEYRMSGTSPPITRRHRRSAPHIRTTRSQRCAFNKPGPREHHDTASIVTAGFTHQQHSRPAQPRLY